MYKFFAQISPQTNQCMGTCMYNDNQLVIDYSGKPDRTGYINIELNDDEYLRLTNIIHDNLLISKYNFDKKKFYTIENEVNNVSRKE